MEIKGNIWMFGDHVDTDLIIPARFLNVSDDRELAKNCFIDIRPEFSSSVQPRDILIAGTNFGCGSSREHAPRAIKAAGIGVVIAASFARIFYRNAFNIGLPILEAEEAVKRFKENDQAVVNLESGEIRHIDGRTGLFAKPIPDFMREIIESGGLIGYVKKQSGSID